MHPFIPIAALGVAAYFLFFGKKSYSVEERAAGMTMLADLLYKVIVKVGTPAERHAWAAQAVKIAGDMFGMSKTVDGIRSGRGMPKDELWPGANMSVADYMATYVATQKRKLLPAAKLAAPKYNDEAPVPPFEDPRKIRAQAIATERSNPVAAKILHTKADSLNTLIRGVKLKNNAVSMGKGILSALKS